MDFAHPEYLVTPNWLADHLHDPAVVILDVTAMLTAQLVNRAATEVFARGHIPSSIFFDIASANGLLADKTSTLPWTWPSCADFERTMEDFGISNQSHVILVASTPRPDIDSGTMWCTRGWWLMHHFGIRCSILAGGLELWQAEDYPLSTDTSDLKRAAKFTAIDKTQQAVATRQQVLQNIDQDNVCIVDALAPAHYNGRQANYGTRKGHIKGAQNLYYRALFRAETALFHNPTVLHRQLADLLAQPEVVVYCGGAIAATVTGFALKLLGYEAVRIYDGCLLEWSSDDNLPMTNPDAA